MLDNEIRLDALDFKNIVNVNNVEVKEVSIKDMAIIGIDIKLPGIDGIDEFWTKLKNAVDCIGEFPMKRRKDIEEYLQYKGQNIDGLKYLKGGYLSEIDQFDFSFFRLTPKEASLMDPIQRLLLETSWNAIEDAGYGGKKIMSTNTGVYVGITNDLEGEKYKQIVSTVEKKDEIQLAIAGNMASIVPSRISYLLDLKGPSLLVDTACSSSLVALHLACKGIRNGDCKQAIVGGINLNLFPLDNQIKIGIESSDGLARTFDDNSDGTGIGEGVIAILIKPLNTAIQDKDNIYAVIKGTAMNQDGRSMGITAPNALAQADVISKAWKDARINPESISYIEAHGTGTVLGDPIEVDGIRKAFSRYTDKKQFCAIGSVKSNIGHLYGAAGLAGVAKAALALKNKELPPTNHFTMPNRKIFFEESPVYVNDKLRKWEAEDGLLRCGVSSFGFSGTNCHVILEQAPKSNKEKRIDHEDTLIFTLSAKCKDAFKKMISIYVDKIKNSEELDYRDVCNTLCTGREHYKYRLAFLVFNQNDFIDKIKRLKKLIDNDFNHLDDFIFYGEASSNAFMRQQKLEEEYQNLIIGGIHETKCTDIKILKDICDLYVKGVEIEWEKIYSGMDLYKLRLPGYPFMKKRCWVEIPTNYGNKKEEAVRLKGGIDNCYSDTEKIIAQICKEVLGFDEIDINDNFLEVGGDSILLAKVYERVEKSFPGKITMSQVFVYPTISKLSMYINSQCENNSKKLAETKAVDEELDMLFDKFENGEISLDDIATRFSNI